MEIEINSYVAMLICIVLAAFIGYVFGKIKISKSYHRIKQLEQEKLGCDFEILDLQRKNKELVDRLTLSIKRNGVDLRISSKQD
jgi:hypothetical protein